MWDGVNDLPDWPGEWDQSKTPMSLPRNNLTPGCGSCFLSSRWARTHRGPRHPHPRHPMLRRCLVLLIGFVTLSSVLATDLWIQRRLAARQPTEQTAAANLTPEPGPQGR